MAQALAGSSQVAAMQIPVKYSMEKPYETFNYTATTTIGDLHRWIQENEGNPLSDQLRFIIVFPKTACSGKKRELPKRLAEKIAKHIAGATYLEVAFS